MLYSVNVGGVGSLWTFSYLKRYFIAFLKVFELYILELVGVEKELFVLSFKSNESKSSVSQSRNSSFLHCCKRNSLIRRLNAEY